MINLLKFAAGVRKLCWRAFWTLLYLDLILDCLGMNWRLHVQHACRADRLSELLMLEFPPQTQHAWTAASHDEV